MTALLRWSPVIIAIVLLVAAIVDIIRIEPERVRGLPKAVWALIALTIVLIGPILWFTLGREPLDPRGRRRTRTGPLAPDDDPEFLHKIAKEKEREKRIRELEEQLSELDEEDPENPREG